MKYLRVILTAIWVAASCSCSRPEWTKEETVQWYDRNLNSNERGLGYLGSDERWHHYRAQYMDVWVFIKIRRADLVLAEELPLKALVHYDVDPHSNFGKLEKHIH